MKNSFSSVKSSQVSFGMLETICHFLCVMKKWVMINDSLDVTMASHVAFRANLEHEMPYHHFETGSKTGSRASLLCNSWLPNKKGMVVTTNRDQIWVIKCPANWIYILCMTVILKICYVFFRYVISKQHKMSNLQNFYPKLSRFDIFFQILFFEQCEFLINYVTVTSLTTKKGWKFILSE